MTPDVSIVVVTYNNTVEQVGALIDSIPAAMTSRPPTLAPLTWETIIIDNGSTRQLDRRADFGRVGAHVTYRATNIGFGRACNQAAAVAKGTAILLVNPDMTLYPYAVANLVTFADQHPEAGIVGGVTVDQDGNPDRASAFAPVTRWSLLCFATGLSTLLARWPRFNPETLDDPASVETVDVAGCLMLIDREVWAELGGFDHRFFMYFEDVDLCWRARDAGWYPRTCGTAFAAHEIGGSSSVGNRRVMTMKGRVTLLRVWWPVRKARTAVTMLRVGAWLRSVAARTITGTGVALPDSLTSWIEVWERREEWSHGW